MTDPDLAFILTDPVALLQLVALLLVLLTMAVAALTSIVTVNVMPGRRLAVPCSRLQGNDHDQTSAHHR
ncbi:MAG: hypothetical protein HC829_07075 [Bacteroidales bacterium]|nr:hypothetical protein [Bacteroidales bacterium]